MKSSNEAQIQHAFTQQAAGFESKRMNFSKQDYLYSVVQKIVPSKTDAVLEVGKDGVAHADFRHTVRAAEQRQRKTILTT